MECLTDGLILFALQEMNRMDLTTLDLASVKRNGTFQRRAEFVSLVLAQVRVNTRTATSNELFDMTNRIKKVADVLYDKQGFWVRRYRKVFWDLVEEIESYAVSEDDRRMIDRYPVRYASA